MSNLIKPENSMMLATTQEENQKIMILGAVKSGKML
jgi:hypothetical protein